MSKVAIVYWSGTGNTEEMANLIAQGAKEAGADVSLYTPSDFNAKQINDFDVVAFGCPAMGAEQLEDVEFEPMFTDCIPELNGKKIALFGSYGWGDGEWLRGWEDTCKEAGAVLVAESLMVNGAPSDQAPCIELGKALA